MTIDPMKIDRLSVYDLLTEVLAMQLWGDDEEAPWCQWSNQPASERQKYRDRVRAAGTVEELYDPTPEHP